MDERVRETYRKIYAELFSLILLGCSVSVIWKMSFLNQNIPDCIPEFPILVGSPVYMTIRSRMLGVTQAEYLKGKTVRKRSLGLVCAALMAVFVFTAVCRGQGDKTDWKSVLVFGGCFIISFVLGQVAFRKLEERRQRKLDSKYEE